MKRRRMKRQGGRDGVWYRHAPYRFEVAERFADIFQDGLALAVGKLDARDPLSLADHFQIHRDCVLRLVSESPLKGSRANAKPGNELEHLPPVGGRAVV